MGRSLMSSILLKPIMRRPSKSMEEYREETLTIGSPMVFQTAPPQPASKARMICSPQLVGGPEASQKGFGEWMPAKLVRRSAMLHPDVGQPILAAAGFQPAFTSREDLHACEEAA